MARSAHVYNTSDWAKIFGFKKGRLHEFSEYTMGRKAIPDDWRLPNVIPLTIQERLVVRRWRAGMTQEQVAAKMKIGREYVKRMETGTTPNCMPLVNFWISWEAEHVGSEV